MKKNIYLISIFFILLLVSCSLGGNQDFRPTDDSNEKIENAMVECINRMQPSSTETDGTRTYRFSNYKADNGIVMTGVIITDSDRKIISVVLSEFMNETLYGEYNAEIDSNGNLVATTRYVTDISIILKDESTKLYADGFSPSLFLVSVSYNEGDNRLLSGDSLVSAEYERDPETGLAIWTGKVEATYGGITKTREFVLTENEDSPSMEKIIVSAEIVQTGVFLEGQKFTKENFYVNVTYSNGTHESMPGALVSCQDAIVTYNSIVNVSLPTSAGVPVSFSKTIVVYDAYDLEVTPISEPIEFTLPDSECPIDADLFKVSALYKKGDGKTYSMELIPEEEYTITLNTRPTVNSPDIEMDLTGTVHSRIFDGKTFSVKGIRTGGVVVTPSQNLKEEILKLDS